MMKVNRRYLISFMILFLLEVVIALFVHDQLIRPFIGDVLVVLLMYCFIRGLFNNRNRWMVYLPFYLFLFAFLIEFLQYFELIERLRIDNKIIKVILGSVFDINDIICYLIGAIICFLIQYIENSLKVDFFYKEGLEKVLKTHNIKKDEVIVSFDLKDKSYNSIKDNERISYGGNQGWFYNNNIWSRDSRINNGGCGLIGAIDVLLYSERLKNQTVNSLEINEQFLTKEYYMNYVRALEKSYFHVFDRLGVLGPFLARGINRYSKYKELDLKARWGVDRVNWLNTIIENLNNDRPTIISVGPWYLTPSKYRGVKFYDYKNKQDQKMQYTSVSGHYVVVTGVEINKATSKIMMKTSSWGKVFYIDFEEYMNYSKYNSLMTNILFIK